MTKQDPSEKKNTEVPAEIIRGITYKRVKVAEVIIQPWKGPKAFTPKDPEGRKE
jgi:hypothetical protein